MNTENSFGGGENDHGNTNRHVVTTTKSPSARSKSKNKDSVLEEVTSTGRDEHLAPCSDITLELVKLQRLRMMQIARHQQINLPMQAAIRTFCGYNPFAEAKEANAAKARAQNIWNVLAKGKGALAPEDHEIAEAVELDVAMAVKWMKEIEDRRDAQEREMVKLAENLPAAAWVKATSGFSLKGLAIITAEARADIQGFRTISRLWKRLGWANDGYKAQMDCSKKRKAEVYACVTECVLKAQSALYENDADGNKTDKVKRHVGPYRRFYDEAKAKLIAKNEAGHFAARAADELKKNTGASDAQKKTWAEGKLTPAHLHARALRELTCQLLLDLWRVSRGLEPQVDKPKIAEGHAKILRQQFADAV